MKKMNPVSLSIISLVLLIGFIYLFSRTGAFSGQLNLFSSIFSGAGGHSYSVYSKATTTSLQRVISVGYFNYGRTLILVGIALLIIFISSIHTGLRHLSFLNQTLILMLIVYSLFAFVNMVAGTSIGALVGRMLRYVLLLSILLIASAGLPYLLSIPKTTVKRILTILLIVALIHTVTIGVEMAYGRPELNSYAAPITAQDYHGMQTFFDIRSDLYLVEEISSRAFQYRYYDYIWGDGGNKVNIRDGRALSLGRNEQTEHFGYNAYVYSGDRYDDKRYQLLYLPVGEYHRLFEEQSLYYGDVSNKDVEHLDYDFSAVRIQDGGQFQVYLMQPITTYNRL